MARSLNESRRAVAERLDRQVDEIDGGAGDNDLPHWQKVADGRQLRGLPALSKFAEGSAIHGSQPGWDLFGDDE